MNKDDKIYEESLTCISDAQAIFALAFEEGQNQFKKKVISALNRKKALAHRSLRISEDFLIYEAGIVEAIETVKEL